MRFLRTLAAALFSVIGLTAAAQTGPSVPNASRTITYNVSSSTSNFDVPFALYGDCTDLTVTVNNAPTTFGANWTCASKSGIAVANVARPITDGQVRFFSPITSGTVTISGNWHPRWSMGSSAGITRTEFNRSLGTIVSGMRERFDNAGGGGGGGGGGSSFSLLNTLTLSIKDTTCGALGDGVTNDTPAFAACINYVNTAGTGEISLPCGRYYIRDPGAGNAVFPDITSVINIHGVYGCTYLVLDPAISTSRDLFHIVGRAGAGRIDGITFEDFMVVPAGTPSARHAFHFDCTPTAPSTFATTTFGHVTMRRVGVHASPIVTFPTPPAVAGDVVHVTNPTVTHPADGSHVSPWSGAANADGCLAVAFKADMVHFAAAAGKCDFFLGENSGDSLWIVNSQITGSGCAVSLSQVGGAGHFLLRENSISATGGINVAAAIAPRILFNIMELAENNTEPNNAIIDINGASQPGGIYNPEIIGNQVQYNSGLTAMKLVRLDNTNTAVIDGGMYNNNSASITSGYPTCIEITSNSVNTTVHPDTMVLYNTCTIVNSSSNTMKTQVIGFNEGVWTAYVPTVTSAGGTAGTVTINNARYFKTNKIVRVFIDVTVATGTGTGDVLITSPFTMGAATFVGSGLENVSGKAIRVGAPDTTHFGVRFYDATTVLSGTPRVLFEGFFESTS